MKFICPRCTVSFKSNDSRYNIWSCDNCGCKFRGIHADANMFDYVLHLIPFTPWFFNLDTSYNLKSANGGPDVTKCPFCFSYLRGFGGKSKEGVWPTVCCKCCRELPTSHYKEIKSKPQTPQKQTSDDEKKDFKKLRELIDRLGK